MKKISSFSDLVQKDISLKISAKISLLPAESNKLINLIKAQKSVFKLTSREKDKEFSHNLIITLDERVFERGLSPEEYEKTFSLFGEVVKTEFNSNIFADFHLSPEKYSTVPALPAVTSNKETGFGTPTIVGIKFLFQDAKTDLKGSFIEVTPCLDCGYPHERVNLLIRRKIKFSLDSFRDLFNDAVAFSKFFYERKDKDSKNKE
jgi:hypothetical protein